MESLAMRVLGSLLTASRDWGLRADVQRRRPPARFATRRSTPEVRRGPQRELRRHGAYKVWRRLRREGIPPGASTLTPGDTARTR